MRWFSDVPLMNEAREQHSCDYHVNTDTVLAIDGADVDSVEAVLAGNAQSNTWCAQSDARCLSKQQVQITTQLGRGTRHLMCAVS